MSHNVRNFSERIIWMDIRVSLNLFQCASNKVQEYIREKRCSAQFLCLLTLRGHIFPSHCLSPPNPRCFCQTSSGRQSSLMWELGIYLEVVNISLCPHHHFVGWDRLAAGAARPAVPKQSANTKTQIAQSVQPPNLKPAASFPPPSLSPTSCASFSFLSPDVVTPTQNHAPFAVAGGANVPQLGLAARALEAASVPVAFHGEEEEAIGDLSPTSCTRPGGRRYAWCLAVHHAALRGSWTNRTEVWQLRQVFTTFIRHK